MIVKRASKLAERLAFLCIAKPVSCIGLVVCIFSKVVPKSKAQFVAAIKTLSRLRQTSTCSCLLRAFPITSFYSLTIFLILSNNTPLSLPNFLCPFLPPLLALAIAFLNFSLSSSFSARSRAAVSRAIRRASASRF